MGYAISVIIPCYNEARRLPDTLASIRAFVSQSTVFDDGDVEWIFVDDGSTDATRALIEEQAAVHPHIVCVSLPDNRGKGAAVKEGDRVARAPIRAFTDCDLSSPLTALDTLYGLFRESRPDLVITSRHTPSSHLAHPQPWPRFVAGRLFSFVISHFHRSAFTDTQCGLKAWHAQFSASVIQRLEDPGWSFDIEMIGRAESQQATILELPIVWSDREGSTVRALIDGPSMLRRGLEYYLRFAPRTLMALALVTGVLAVLTAMQYSVDFVVYYDAWHRARTLDLEGLYTPERVSTGGFYYSPLFALLGAPLTLLSPTAARVVYVAFEFGLLFTSVMLLKRWTRYQLGGLSLRVVLWATFLVLFLNQVLGQFQSGNVDLLIVLLCLASGYSYLFQHKGLAAFWLGLAINIKVFPVFLLGFAVLQRDWRFIGYVVIALAVLGIAPALYFGWDNNWQLHMELRHALAEYGAENDYAREHFQSLPSTLFRLATHLGWRADYALRAGQLLVVAAATGVWWTFRRRMRSDWVVVFSFFLAFTAQFVPSSWVNRMGFYYAPIALLTLQGWALDRRWPYSPALVVFLLTYALSTQAILGRGLNDLVETWAVPTIGIWVFLIGAYLYWRKERPALGGASLRMNLAHLAPGARRGTQGSAPP